MRRVAVLTLALLCAAVAFAQAPQQGNGQAYPEERGPYQSGQYLVLPVAATPMVPYGSAFPNTATGTTQYFYWIVTNDVDNGLSSQPAGPFVVGNGPASLSATASNTIQWQLFMLPLTYGMPSGTAASYGGSPLVTNNVTYDILETSTSVPPTGACNCAVATGLTNSSVKDTGSYSSYTVAVFSWPNGYPTQGDAVGFGPKGLLVDLGAPSVNPVANCATAGTNGNAAYYTDATHIGCDSQWFFTGSGQFGASGIGSYLNLTFLQNFGEPFCNVAGVAGLVSTTNLRLCAESNTAAGSLGLWHAWNFVGSHDDIFAVFSSFQNTSGPTGINFTASRPNITATLAGTGFGAAGGSHSVGIVPDPGATPHTPAYYLGDDNAFHNPASISPGTIGGTPVTQFQILIGSAGYSCSGDQNVCGFTLTWPTSWADSSYSAVCNPTGPSNTSGSESLTYGGSGSQTTTQINVYIVSNGASGGTYSGFVCWGWHQ